MTREAVDTKRTGMAGIYAAELYSGSDTTFDRHTRSILVGTAGNLTAKFVDGSAAVTIPVTTGRHPYWIESVTAATTTAAAIVFEF